MKILFLWVLFTQNNIFLTITNYKGNVISWKSLGNLKVKGLKKLNNSLIKTFIYQNFNLNYLNFKFHIKSRGLNKFKKMFLRSLLIYLNSSILSFEDFLLKSNNGCKIKKKRRL
uniref:Ribosomal protein S11 n=1 Tax=Herposiphonia versicolor TaxID=2007163 RepID=UPI0022FD5276|nr:Ribosomal protein S11 [Herposiphonia versicolor]WAX04190.1 Ribosomal protein S11 [Herposiphonia versicolor]